MARLEIDNMEYSTDALIQAAFVSAYGNTGGNSITTDGDYTVHTFTTSGTFTPLKAGTVKILVVAGGGCSQQYTHYGGGGGGGGLIYNVSYSLTSGAKTVTVGTGAVFNGADATNSVFGDQTAIRGGRGGQFGEAPHTAGQDGGSGGGGGDTCLGGNGTTGQGYAGGRGGTGTPACGGGGGAGEAGAQGGDNLYSVGGDGGDGLSYDIRVANSYVYYSGGGGGGGGGTNFMGPGGYGLGGGPGNYGGGGMEATNGGPGIVVVRCKTSDFLSVTPTSEATVKTQGSYALKGVADITTGLNKTVTKTFASPLNLSGVKNMKFDIRASRTGANIKLGLHDSGGTTSEITPTILTADTWQTVTWNLMSISDTNKDVIDTLIITVINADSANTFYLDNFNVAPSINLFAWTGG